jgi:hypothetical protein
MSMRTTDEPTMGNTDEPAPTRSAPPIGLIVVAVLVAIVVAFAVVWVVGIRGEDDAQDTAGSGVVPSDILDDPSAYEGREVQVVAPVDEIVPPAGFTLDGGLLIVGIPNGQVQQAMEEDWSVTVWGTVQPFDGALVEREVGQPVPEDVARAYEGQPMVLSERVAAGEGS